MAAPVMRRFTLAAPAALNAFAASTDDISGQTFYEIAQALDLLDLFNDPDPAAGLRYEFRAFKNGFDTGRSFFSNSLSTASAGRAAIGPVTVTPGQLQFQGAQRAGALTATSIVAKFSGV